VSVGSLLVGHVHDGHHRWPRYRGGVRSKAAFVVRRWLFLLRRTQCGGARIRGSVGAHPSRKAAQIKEAQAQEASVAAVLVGARPAATRHVRGFRSILSSGRIAEHQRQRGFRRWRIRRSSAATVAPQRMHANVRR